MESQGETLREMSFDDVVAASPAMRRVVGQARRAADVDSPVLLVGEPGTGKQLIASRIHQASRRRDAELVVFRAAGQGTREQELFGGGMETPGRDGGEAPGAFARAAGGTLLLKNVDALGPTSQARLVGFLEARKAVPGDPRRASDVRLIATASENLLAAIERGRLRSDLYYHLSVICIDVPPLRKRREDIPELIEEFLARVRIGREMPPVRMEPRMVRAISTLDWPGNAGQLQAVVESIVATARSQVLAIDDVKAVARAISHQPSQTGRLAEDGTLATMEKEAVESALRQYDGNRTQAARSLGISVRTLQRKLKRWRLEGA